MSPLAQPCIPGANKKCLLKNYVSLTVWSLDRSGQKEICDRNSHLFFALNPLRVGEVALKRVGLNEKEQSQLDKDSKASK